MQLNQGVNPYAVPTATVRDEAGSDERDTEFRLRLFSSEGRIGRVRYLGYSIGLSLLLYAVGAALAAAALGVLGTSAGMILAGVLVAVAYILLFVIQIMLTIKRSHDFNSSGWLSLLLFVPVANLIFLFIPGTKGINQFGPRTAPNGKLAIILACLLPLVFVIGILAAVAIPAYQQYTLRAQAAGYEQVD
ncbi:MAG: DUF805 domain-containing protein [Candidatus Dactylopiibacterium carminicum]|uniref:DUF805 domain-containing protein n=1 Tax=Candidatus Dactylopiibacterium carminicum TaxID=857335 RepID=A0A272ETM2_9RHOO|nr:DUF805 domain-containing protein [Candidatus Dactylopiibacterium carminicum]KAF7599393.1 DUF805 domain-containing protein [Candidatus Dactylopiibacterium carminicum]PAS93449.1 MAG: DUF805 domain-containing protein [Candidatus Dactylopiibacterium carminicum]PAS95968.1 MAG: DUF805 domain-containing protein [Candidatus Dactylopiibacterium carminicum]PAS99402.1 MAG: hypothetical protein BSR46_08020 [Candidatus Dactylopiibacterium carminicum]